MLQPPPPRSPSPIFSDEDNPFDISSTRANLSFYQGAVDKELKSFKDKINDLAASLVTCNARVIKCEGNQATLDLRVESLAQHIELVKVLGSDVLEVKRTVNHLNATTDLGKLNWLQSNLRLDVMLQVAGDSDHPMAMHWVVRLGIWGMRKKIAIATFGKDRYLETIA